METPFGAGLETRGEMQRGLRSIRPLVTHEVKVDEIGADQLKELQRSDATLEELFATTKAKEITTTRNNGNIRYVVKNGILTRYFYRIKEAWKRS